ncbi:xenotropic and polytropic retrovirus receptor 1-like isoform X2 [Hylaeus volcanicus]|uniref:xenotropic and polytropic retrovirus receptor 1-like isoform X2 n=1 Tax=Hylaeus volcanicus TaxID=313075 RepID=UPI0023B7A82E|nr:xenotropic and polytropic retrovirus receptor 1-like isoform X2 [Hylaeus volcanicus]
MKFTEHLSAHITPEWRKQYVNYEEMKALLYAAVEQAPTADTTESHVLERYFNKFDEKFFHYCDKELAKINTFYSEKLAEATRRFAALNNELSEILSVSEDKQANRKIRYRNNILHKKPVSARKLQELKLAFSEFYLFLILLQNYQNLNFTGFRKILKKHDKLLNIDLGAKWKAEHVDTALFHTHKDIDRLIAETEALVTRDLEHGDRQRAMKRLRVPPLGEQLSPWVTFKVGIFSGAFIVLLIAVILSGVWYRDNNNWRVLCRLYRGPLLMIQFLFLMGINVYGWRSSGVNHVLIFELDPRNHLSEQHIIEMASVFGLVWSLSILGFLYSEILGIPPFVQPMLLYTLLALFLFNPTKTLRREARFWALRVLGRIFCAPFFYVGFADFWLADQLNSLHTVFLDFQYFVCFYVQNSSWTDVTDAETCIMRELSMRPFVACLPAWFRFAQCLRRYRDTKEAFPHLINAAKYATSFFVVVFSYLHLTNSILLLLCDNRGLHTSFWMGIFFIAHGNGIRTRRLDGFHSSTVGSIQVSQKRMLSVTNLCFIKIIILLAFNIQHLRNSFYRTRLVYYICVLVFYFQQSLIRVIACMIFKIICHFSYTKPISTNNVCRVELINFNKRYHVQKNFIIYLIYSYFIYSLVHFISQTYFIFFFLIY